MITPAKTAAVAPAASLEPDYFDAVYAAHDDPWQFETSDYEAAKYRRSVAALGGRRFTRGFEIGCSIGVLTAQLAAHCDALLAVDVSAAALSRARQRCAGLGPVRFERMHVPQEFPAGDFDLVVMSEVGYYWSLDDLHKACDRIAGALVPGGLWLLVHWTPPVPDYPLTGDAVHDTALARAAGRFAHVGAERQAQYRLDLLQKL